MNNRLCLFTAILLFCMTVGAVAQKQKPNQQKTNQQKPSQQKPKQQKSVKTIKTATPSPTKVQDDPGENEKRVTDMVTFLGFMLNTLGSSSTSARDKEVLITESYSKIFRDDKVQIEDDLDEERGVITNKDVVAYLKDINFFFKEVKFEFIIDKIEPGLNSDNQTYYKVSLHRNLSGTTSDDKIVNNIVQRYIEINYDSKQQDLKIVSIYTNEINEKDALLNWWKELSYEWQALFRKKYNLTDSVEIADIRKITSQEELDLSNNKYIQSFAPLSQLKSLKFLNLSFTNINDLTPVRNLTEIVDLNLSHTSIHDLLPLKYSSNLMALNLSNTEVSDISIIQRMSKLQSLDITNTNTADLTPLANLSNLVILNLHGTRVAELSAIENLNQLSELNIATTPTQDLSPLKGLRNLKILVCDSTGIKNINAIGNLENLKILQANNTLISDLQPLYKLPHLEKVYCDQTPINKTAADAFMTANPRVLVVYDSHDLKSWWASLSSEWQHVISKVAKISLHPSKEELARVDQVDSINISSNYRITDLEPLRKFQKLTVVMANQTSIGDLAPLREHKEIKYLDISETRVADLTPLVPFTRLKILKADKCKIESIDRLQTITSLEKLYVDESGVNDINAREFLQANPACLLIYKTVHLNRWWRNISESWKQVFLTSIPDTTRENFHKLVELEAFHFKDSPVSDLSGLSEFIRLKELHFSGTGITNITPIENLTALKSLHASHGPIQITESLSQLTDLEDLDISDTPTEDITLLWKFQKLKRLNCAGTQIKKLNALEKLENLEFLDCSNTNVSKLTPLDYLHLKTLKCYNTRISNRAIETFKASHPECNVIYYR